MRMNLQYLAWAIVVSLWLCLVAAAVASYA